MALWVLLSSQRSSPLDRAVHSSMTAPHVRCDYGRTLHFIAQLLAEGMNGASSIHILSFGRNTVKLPQAPLPCAIHRATTFPLPPGLIPAIHRGSS